MMIKKDSKIFIAGHRGLVGSAILKGLQDKGYTNFLLRTHAELDLTNQKSTQDFFEENRPDYVFLAAAKVGGIMANNIYRADFISENLMIQNNVISSSYKYGVKKLLFLGSTCIYPRSCPQPMREEYLLTSELEYTNEPYAIAKIAGIKMCESYNLQYGTNFVSVMPTNLYGPNDNFDLEKSHVLPALIRKIHLGKCLQENNWDAIRADLARNPLKNVKLSENNTDILLKLNKYGVYLESETPQIEIWGSGTPMREFLWSEDMADASIFILENVDFDKLVEHGTAEVKNTHINIGTGSEISIKDLVLLIKDIVGYKGDIYFNTEKPDGTMRKLTDVAKLNKLGWKHKISITEGVKKMYEWYMD